MACGHLLSALFQNLERPEGYISAIKHREEIGDGLIAEAYDALESLPYSELVGLVQQFMRHLDDIVDGLNDTARVIDIFTPSEPELAAEQILDLVLEMVARLAVEMGDYPDNTLERVKDCRLALKRCEEKADGLYHEWRKSHRRLSTLSLISETDWTEILGILEGTTDACYHAALLLERITKWRLRQAS
ncbi:DUF47 domain-containing protein [Candidatus Methylocalor cossyra]